MDTRTGEIHELNAGETVDDLAKRLGGKPSDYVPISHRPDGNCGDAMGLVLFLPDSGASDSSHARARWNNNEKGKT